MADGAFTQFNVASDIINSIDSTTGTVWSGNAPRLTGAFTSSVQAASNSGQYYIHVYQTASTDTSAAVQFDIAYTDQAVSGSLDYNSLVPGKSPSSTIYGQYQNIALGDDTLPFTFGNFTGSNFYALSIERARYKESIALGTMTLSISGSDGSAGSPANGGVTLTLTDNSRVSTGNVFGNAGRVYQLVSGSEGVVYTGIKPDGFTPASGSYGLFLPDVGLILLNAAALDGNQPFATDGGINLGTLRQSNTNSNNNSKLFSGLQLAITGSGANYFRLNSQETLASDFYFVRAQNSEFNYSSNPSFVTGSTGALLWPTMQNNPQTFITSVGLYNDSNELCAVAKLSRPLVKDFTKELLVRVKLDY